MSLPRIETDYPYHNLVAAMFRDLFLDLRGEGYAEIPPAEKHHRQETAKIIRYNLQRNAQYYVGTDSFDDWAVRIDLDPEDFKRRLLDAASR